MLDGALRPRRMGFERERGVLEVLAEGGFSSACVDLGDPGSERRSPVDVLRLLAERRVSIRFARIHPGCLSFLVRGENLAEVRDAVAAAGLSADLEEGCAVVTVVAPNVRSITGLMARAGEALDGRGVRVHQTADSHSSVSCVVPEAQMAEAVAALGAAFELAGCGRE